MTENFIKNVVAAMQDSLTDEQLQKLENVLAINLHGLEVKAVVSPPALVPVTQSSVLVDVTETSILSVCVKRFCERPKKMRKD